MRNEQSVLSQLFSGNTTSTKEAIWNDVNGVILASIKTGGDEDILTYHEYGSKYDPTSVITHEFVKRDHVKMWSKYGKRRMDVSDDTFCNMIKELNAGFIPEEFLDSEEYDIDENRRRIKRDFDGEWGTITIYHDDFDDIKYRKETYIYNKNLLLSLLVTYKNKPVNLIPFFTVITQTLYDNDTFNRTIYHCTVKGTMEEFEEYIKNPQIPEDNIIMKESLTNKQNGQSHYSYDVDYRYLTDEIAPEEIYYYHLVSGQTKMLTGYRPKPESVKGYSNVADIFFDGDKYKFDVKDIESLFGAPSFTSVFSDSKSLLSKYMEMRNDPDMPTLFNRIYRSHMEYKNYKIATLVVPCTILSNVILHGTLHREYLKGNYAKKSDTIDIIDSDRNPYIDQVNINPNLFVYDFHSKKNDLIDYHIRLVLGMSRKSNKDNNAIMAYNNRRHIVYFDEKPYDRPENDLDIKEYMEKTGKELFYLYDKSKNAATDRNYMKTISLQLETTFKIQNFTIHLNSTVAEYSERRLTIQEDDSDIVFEFYNNTMTIKKGEDIKITADNENREFHFWMKDHSRENAEIQFDIAHRIDYRNTKGVRDARLDSNFTNRVSVKKSDIVKYDIREKGDHRKIVTTDVKKEYYFNSFLREIKPKKSDKDKIWGRHTVISIYDRDIAEIVKTFTYIREELNRFGSLDKINEQYTKMKKIIPEMMRILFSDGSESSLLRIFYLMSGNIYSPDNKYPDSKDMFCLDIGEVYHPNYWVNTDSMFRKYLNAKVMGFMDSTMFVMDRIITDTGVVDFKKIFNFI